jgi:parallel beta-helix repeat protein
MAWSPLTRATAARFFPSKPGKSTLRGIHLTGSGDNHDTDDSCLDVRGHGNVVENLVIDNCLFGIDLKQSSDNIVRGNTGSSPNPRCWACVATAFAFGTATTT